MAFPIDVAFLSSTGKVLGTVSAMMPGGTAQCDGASCVLELSAGRLMQTHTQVGDTIQSFAYPDSGIPGVSLGAVQRGHTRTAAGIGQLTPTSAASIMTAGVQTAAGIMAGLTAAIGSAASTGGISLAITGAIELGTLLYNVFKGCGPTCTEATSLVNQAAPLLQQNLNNYLSAQAAGANYASFQSACLTYFDSTWAALMKACETSQLGAAGQNCIADRAQGACKYKTSPSGWQVSPNSPGGYSYVGAGANGSGTTCWNWYVGYRDPIANDPTVIPDPVATGAAVTGDGTGTGSSTNETGGSTTTTTAGAIANALTSGSSPLPILLAIAALILFAVEG